MLIIAHAQQSGQMAACKSKNPVGVDFVRGKCKSNIQDRSTSCFPQATKSFTGRSSDLFLASEPFPYLARLKYYALLTVVFLRTQQEITAAGTVVDSHDIPSMSLSGTNEDTNVWKIGVAFSGSMIIL